MWSVMSTSDMNYSVTNGSVMNGVCYERVCYECGLLWTHLLRITL